MTSTNTYIKPPKTKFNNNKPRLENVNENIRASHVRAVFEDGSTQILATSQALLQAKALNVDLVLVSPNAVPPVAKLIEIGKFLFAEKKRKHDVKRNQHVVHIKELKFRPNTDDHDYDFKCRHAIEFLQEGHKVKATVMFKGREIAHTDLGRNLLLRLASDLKPYGNLESEPRLEGKNASLLIGPLPQKK